MMDYSQASHARRIKAMPGFLALAAVMPLAATVTAGINTTAWGADPLAEHVDATGLTDTGNASTTPTAFYRQQSVYGGNNLGNITVLKESTAKYTLTCANNLNGGAGDDHGTLTIAVADGDNQFGSDESIILLGFTNVTYGNISSGSLTTLENALTSADISWQDMNGLENNWPNLYTPGQFDPLNGPNGHQSTSAYELELGFVGPYSSSGMSYFDFNFAGELGTAGNVVNIAVVPEPATISLLMIGGTTLLLRRRPRTTRGCGL